MKKIFLTILASVFAVSTYAENRITVADVNILSGGTAVVAVSVSLEDVRNSFMTTVTLPAGLTITDVDAGPIYDSPIFAKNNTEGTTWKISAMCSNAYLSTEGALVYITIEDDGSTNAVGDVLTINFSGFELGNGNAAEAYFPANTSCQVTITDRVVLDENATAPFIDQSGVDVTVNRTITGGIWNTIVLPFEVTDIESVFGTGALVAEFAGLTTDGSVTVTDNIDIEFSSTDYMDVGTPYIVKPVSNISSFDVDGVDIEYADGPSTGVQTNGKTGKNYVSTFTGTYLANTVIPEHSIFLSNNKFFVAGDGTTKTKAFRAYFTAIWNKNVVSLSTSSTVKIFVDGVETAIEGINADVKSNKVYSIDGKYIGEDVDLNRMQKGIYIVNGKKVINK